MIRRLSAFYGKPPILYATRKAYQLYLTKDFKQCDIWIRDVYFPPALEDKRPWTFWQYSGKGKLKGYQGQEACIDKNVFNGSAEAFAGYVKTGQRR